MNSGRRGECFLGGLDTRQNMCYNKTIYERGVKNIQRYMLSAWAPRQAAGARRTRGARVTNNGRSSIKDIAKAAGVSPGVVAMVLAGNTSSTIGYSIATREKVLAVARRLGYQPNRTARWLRQGRHGAIGVVVQTEHVIPVETLEAMLVSARERGLFVVQDRMSAGGGPMFLEEDSVDGLICFTELDRGSLARIRARKMPVVWVNTNVRRGRNVITYNERGAARRAGEHLRERGWGELGVITRRVGHYSTEERIAGVKEVAPTAPILYAPVEPWEREGAREELAATIEQFLREHGRVNGLLVTNALFLPPLYRALRRLGRTPGRDIGVVTFEWQDVGLLVDPSVTAMVLDTSNIGHRAVEMIHTLVTGGCTERCVIEYYLVERESTRVKAR
ncbi:MAG: LacI family transcriptional regulator [bacterium]|nr:LacI family transcriptional regulator [bacterium]